MYRIIEHTADVGFEVKARTTEELFSEALLALRETIFGKLEKEEDKKRRKTIKKIKIRGIDEEDIIVSYLNELLYLFEVKKLVFTKTKKIKIKKVNPSGNDTTETELEAEIYFVKYDAKIHKIKIHIKSATYHNIKIEKENGCLKTTIILDV